VAPKKKTWGAGRWGWGGGWEGRRRIFVVTMEGRAVVVVSQVAELCDDVHANKEAVCDMWRCWGRVRRNGDFFWFRPAEGRRLGGKWL
jgi:hypothetical protein